MEKRYFNIVGAFNGVHSWDFNRLDITEVRIGTNVTSISTYAFRDYSRLHTLTIPDSVTSFGANVFAGCGSLNSITIPDSVTYINPSGFADSSLSTVYMSETARDNLGLFF